MSFGFGVGDFLAVRDLANKIRKGFVNAPSQFKAIGDELRSLSIVVEDADIAFAQESLDEKQKRELDNIDESCRNVITDLQRILDKNSEVPSQDRNVGKRIVRVWKRFKWDPAEITELRSRITSNITLLSAFKGRFTSDNVFKLVQHQDDQERQAVLDWISPVDFPSQQKDIISRRQDGTGLWLLDSQEYKTWSSLKAQTLFCPGIPGAGKTILSSIVVDDLNARFRDDESVGIAFVYFNFRRQEEQKLDIILAGILKQLLQSHTSLPDSIKALYRRHKHNKTPWPTDETPKELRSVIALYSRVFIVADALNECQNERRADFLSGVCDLKADTELALFATSRFIPKITSRFENSHRLEIRARDHDVEKYLNGHMSRLPACVQRSPKTQKDIVAKIVTAVKGMFLLAQLHLDSLVGKMSLRAINTALKRLETQEHTAGKHATISEAYDKAYDDAMERIKGQVEDASKFAEKVISWITLARRPLATLKLLHALAIEIGDSEFDETNIPQVEDIASACAGLVIVDEESNIIRLVHYTTQEYFERTHQRWFPEAQTGIANSCLTYLRFDSFETGPAPNRDEFDARLRDNTLYEYAALNWGHHARLASTEADAPILSLFESQAKLSSFIQVMVVARDTEYYDNDGPSQDTASKMSGMHVAAHFGLGNMILKLRGVGQDPDLKRHGCPTPLSIAAARGHVEVVEILLAISDVDSDSRPVLSSGANHDGRTPLSFAAGEGHEEVVKLLIAKPGVNVNSRALGRSYSGMSPLSIAASKGHSLVVKQLLAAKGIEVDIKCESGLTPLSYASRDGHEAVVELLLTTGSVDPNSVDHQGWSPILNATWGGHEGIAKILLATGNIDPDSKVRCDSIYWSGWTPLMLAVQRGEAFVRVLLATGKLNVNNKAIGYYHRGVTALILAALHRNECIVQLLLKTGKVDKTITDERGRTALAYATEYRYSNIVSLLQDDL